MNRFYQWLSHRQDIQELSIDLLSAWLFTAGWLFSVCGLLNGLSFGLTAGRAMALSFAGVMLVFLLSRKWWLAPSAAVLGGLTLWRLSHTGYWKGFLSFFSDYSKWWMNGFPQGEDIPYHIQWVQFLTAVLLGGVLLLVMRRMFSFLFLLAGSVGAAVWTALYPSVEGDRGLFPCLALVLMGLIVTLPRIYARYLHTHILTENPSKAKASEGAGKTAVISRASLQLLAVPAAAVCVGLAFWMVPEDTSEWQSKALVHFLWDMGDLLQLSTGTPGNGAWEFRLSDTGYQPEPDRLGGPVELSDDVFFEVKSELPLLLRGSVQDTYTGTGWTDSGNNGRFRLESPMWRGKKKDIFCLDLPRDKRAKELYLRLTQEFSIQIYPLGYQSCTLFTAGRTEGAEFLTFKGDDQEEIFFNAQGELFAQERIVRSYRIYGREFMPRTSGTDQQFLLLERTTLEKSSRRASRELREIGEQYLQLPDSLPQRVYDTAAEIIQGCETPYQKAAAICDWLSQGCTYTLSPEPLPDGRDFVDFFLETREGYCVYYASAMTVLARCTGIPSRFVSGFGMREGENYNWYYTSGETAHAWSEIYLQGIGWIAFDPLGWNPNAVDTADVPESTAPVSPDFYEDSEEEELSEPEFSAVIDEKSNSILLWPAAFVMLILVLGLSIREIYKMPFKLWEEKSLKKHIPEPNLRTDVVYEDLLRQLALLGYIPRVGETSFEFAERVDERLQVGELVRPMRAAAEVIVRMRFGEIPPEDEQEREMTRYHREIEELLRLKLGKWMYFWKRGIPSLCQTGRRLKKTS